jgi:hypothetical protein
MDAMEGRAGGSYRAAMEATDRRNEEENRHSHGDLRHSHPGGNVPHDHDVPVRNPYRGEAMLTTGIIAAILGGASLMWQSSDHSACGSMLVRAASPEGCQTADWVWTLGAIGLVLGVALIIAGAIMRSR